MTRGVFIEGKEALAELQHQEIDSIDDASAKGIGGQMIR